MKRLTLLATALFAAAQTAQAGVIPNAVPDSGSSVGLIALGAVVAFALRRKLRK